MFAGGSHALYTSGRLPAPRGAVLSRDLTGRQQRLCIFPRGRGPSAPIRPDAPGRWSTLSSRIPDSPALQRRHRDRTGLGWHSDLSTAAVGAHRSPYLCDSSDADGCPLPRLTGTSQHPCRNARPCGLVRHGTGSGGPWWTTLEPARRGSATTRPSFESLVSDLDAQFQTFVGPVSA